MCARALAIAASRPGPPPLAPRKEAPPPWPKPLATANNPNRKDQRTFSGTCESSTGSITGGSRESPASVLTSGIAASRSKWGSCAGPLSGCVPSGTTSVLTGALAFARAASTDSPKACSSPWSAESSGALSVAAPAASRGVLAESLRRERASSSTCDELRLPGGARLRS